LWVLYSISARKQIENHSILGLNLIFDLFTQRYKLKDKRQYYIQIHTHICYKVFTFFEQKTIFVYTLYIYLKLKINIMFIKR